MEKIKIELTAYEALSLVAFLHEFEEDFKNPECESIRGCIKVYTDQVYEKVSISQIEDALAENAVMKLVGKAPSNSPSDLR